MVTINEIIQKPIFSEKTSLLLVETVFLASKKPFFIYQIFQAVKTVSPKGNVFFYFSFWLVETNFLSSRNSSVLFRALLKILKFGGSKLFKRNLISARGNGFFG